MDKIKELILKFYTTIDPSGINTKIWKDRFSSMSDAELKKYLKDLDFFRLHSLPYKNQPKYADIKKALNLVGKEMEETIYYQTETVNGDIEKIKVKRKMPVIYLHIKRLQQIVSKKNNFSFSADKRNALTNQVTSDDKVANNTNMESYALNVYGADGILREMLGARSDNAEAKSLMYKDISEKGQFYLEDIDEDIKKKSVINMLDIYLLGAGLKSDLVSPGLTLIQTFENK